VSVQASSKVSCDDNIRLVSKEQLLTYRRKPLLALIDYVQAKSNYLANPYNTDVKDEMRAIAAAFDRLEEMIETAFNVAIPRSFIYPFYCSL
jgi:hypothetical protein